MKPFNFIGEFLPHTAFSHLIASDPNVKHWHFLPLAGAVVAKQDASIAHHGFCHVMKQRSGCGMIARWRPLAAVSAAIPSGDPFGLNGYTSVASPKASVYLQNIWTGLQYAHKYSSN